MTNRSAIPNIGVGMLGYAFMGKAHTNAFKKLGYIWASPPAFPQLIGIAGRDESAVQHAAERYGYAHAYTDWRELLADDDIQLLDNVGPNHLHAEPSIAAAEAGKHVLCEKPLARDADEAKAMWDAAERANVKHMTGFNYRFVPALRQARDLIRSGALGRIYHFRGRYLQESLVSSAHPMTWRHQRETAGSGALGDLGAHIIDLARFLVGEITRVGALTQTFTTERPWADGSGRGRVSVDDAFTAAIEFADGAIGTLEASRVASGRKNHQVIEINGENGSVEFNLERLNELNVYWEDEDSAETHGFHNALITEDHHPWLEHWWPRGHILGWEHTFVHEIAHLLECIVHVRPVGPDGATFEDGYRAALVTDAILASAEERTFVDVAELSTDQ
ncbi:MAG: Gfo/Idh/MocA family protein [Candidatus Bipolaricaulia bacterium]